MFHQTYFCPSDKQQQKLSHRSRSTSELLGSTAAVTPASGISMLYPPISSSISEKSSSLIDIRNQFLKQQFGVGSSIIPPRCIGDCKNAVFAHSTSHNEESTTVSTQQLGPLHLNTSLAQLPSVFSSSDHFHNMIAQDDNINRKGSINENSCSKKLAATDADTTTTATTASSSTSAASPTPSTLSNSSSMEERGENPIEFVLENLEAITDWSKRADIRESDEKANQNVTDRHWEEYKDELMGKIGFGSFQDSDEKFEYNGVDTIDDDDDDDLSCCTPVLDNTSRPQQALPRQPLQRAFVRQQSSSSSITRTTTTETKTTTTTTTQMTAASSMNSSESVISTTLPHPSCHEDIWHQSNVLVHGNSKDSGNNHAAPIIHQPTNSAITTATTSMMTKNRSCCSSCIAKDRQIELQRREIRHMKVAMKRLVLLLAETVNSQQNRIGNDTKQLPAPNSGATASSSCVVPTLHMRRITSLPVASVGKDYPRTTNQRIQLNGQWGTYSGPSCGGSKAGQTKEQNEIDDDSNDETSPEAGIFQGCVVRLDKGDMYVGNLSRNDTGSFTFSPPGTLYDCKGKPIRRVR